jgi:hypothetical protein
MRNRVGVTALLVLSAATLVFLSPNSSTDTPAVAVDSGTEAPGTAGMRAYLDPETGELAMGVAPATEMELDADTQNALRRDTEGLEVVRHADGSESIDLQGRFQSISVVRIDENGKAVVCTDNVEGVKKTLSETAPVSATPEVK